MTYWTVMSHDCVDSVSQGLVDTCAGFALMCEQPATRYQGPPCRGYLARRRPAWSSHSVLQNPPSLPGMVVPSPEGGRRCGRGEGVGETAADPAPHSHGNPAGHGGAVAGDPDQLGRGRV